MKTKLVFVVVIALVIVVVAGVLLMPSHVGSPTNEKIEIPATGADISGPTLGYWTSARVTVHNTGAVTVEIATIYVQGVAYTYSPVTSPGKFSAASNQIAAGQSATFTITPTKPVPESGAVNFKVVTQNGAEADASASA